MCTDEDEKESMVMINNLNFQKKFLKFKSMTRV